MLFLICHSTLALSVAIWVCSCTNNVATIPASSVLFMVLFMLVPSEFTVMIL